jgi:hypothetical protein
MTSRKASIETLSLLSKDIGRRPRETAVVKSGCEESIVMCCLVDHLFLSKVIYDAKNKKKYQGQVGGGAIVGGNHNSVGNVVAD